MELLNNEVPLLEQREKINNNYTENQQEGILPWQSNESYP